MRIGNLRAENYDFLEHLRAGEHLEVSSHRIHDASANGARRPLLRLGMRRKRDRYTNESGKRQESMQHGWFLERLIVIASQASNRVCRETCSVCRSRAELSIGVASFTKGCELKVCPAQIALHRKQLDPVHRRAGSASGAHGIAARHNGQLLLDPDTQSWSARGARFKVVFG